MYAFAIFIIKTLQRKTSHDSTFSIFSSFSFVLHNKMLVVFYSMLNNCLQGWKM